MKMTFAHLVAELMMQVKEYGDCEVTELNITLRTEDGEEFEVWDDDLDSSKDYDECDVLEMGFDPYSGCYTDDC